MKLKIPPVVIVLLLGGLMLFLDRLPMGHFHFPGRQWIAVILVAIGLILAGFGVQAFRSAETTVDPMHPGKSAVLVTSGLYAFSRNPMYLGMASALLGWALYLGTWIAFIALPLFVAWMNHFQIAGEEEALEKRFGQAFRDYRAKVRRWI